MKPNIGLMIQNNQIMDQQLVVGLYVIMILQLGEENMKGHNSPWSNVFINLL